MAPPPTSGPGPTAQPRMSLALIARDEARCIVRCLASVRDVVDEMVVVDTGSLDATVSLAEEAGAQVHHVPWTDDFAAARNAALQRCSGEWRLVLDADEWLAEGAEVLRTVKREPAAYAGLLDIVSETNDGQVTSSTQVRLLPREARYEGRIHEQPVFEGPVRRLAVGIGHDGYLPERMPHKAARNRRLLEVELAEHAGGRDSAYLHLQLGKTYEAEGRHDLAATYYGGAYQMSSPTTAETPGWRHDLVVRLLYALGQTGRTQEAVDMADAELPHWQQSADFHFELGHVLLKHALAHPEAAGELLPLIESCWVRCLELGDTPELTGAVRGKGSHVAAQNLVMFYETQGRTDDAARVRRRFGVS